MFIKKWINVYGSVFFIATLFLFFAGFAKVNANSAVIKVADGWLLENDMVQAYVSAVDGDVKWIRRQVDGSDVLEEGEGASVLITFPNERRSYLTRDSLVENGTIKSDGEHSILELKQRLPGTNLSLITSYIVGDTEISWYVEIYTVDSSAREVQIQHQIPVSKGFDRYFLPAADPVHSFAELASRQRDYHRGFAEGIGLPLVTAYNTDTDLGVSLVQPLALPKPHSEFSLNTGNIDHLIGVGVQNLRLSKVVPAKSGLHLVVHEGDWRPGLGWMLQHYSEYFRPANKEVYRWEGHMMIIDGGAVADYQRAAKYTGMDLVAMGLGWLETETTGFISYGGEPHTEDGWYYGRQVPVDPSQDSIVMKPWNERAKAAKEYGVGTMFYFKIASVLREVAVREFPDAIARWENGADLGAIMYGWDFGKMYPVLNPDPKYSFYEYAIDQAERLIKGTPEGVGIFWDVLAPSLYFDYAHDDGISMIGGTEAYHLSFAYDKLMRDVRMLANKYNKVIWGNQLLHIELGKYIDGVVMETWEDWLMVLQYTAIARPLVYLRYWQDNVETAARTPEEREDSLKACLLSGAFAKIDDIARGGPAMKGYDVFMSYVPLMKLLKQREWVLKAHALTLPDEYKGNIFTTPEHDYIVSVVSPHVSYYDKDVESSKANLRVRVGHDFEITDMYSLSADYEGRHDVEYERDGEYLNITLLVHKSASMLVIDGECN